jgi:hypothetical protein
VHRGPHFLRYPFDDQKVLQRGTDFPRRDESPFPALEIVVEVSLISIKWDHYAENPEARRES